MPSSTIKLLLDVSAVLFVRGFGSVSGFLLSIIVTHLVSVDQAACFFVAFALTNVLGRIVCHGAPVALIRLVGELSDDSWNLINQDFSGCLRLTVRNGVLLAILMWLMSDVIAISVFSKPDLSASIAMSGIAIVFWSICQLFGSAIQGKRQSKLASLIQNTFSPLLFVLISPIANAIGFANSGAELVFIFAVCWMLCSFVGALFWLKDQRASIDFSSVISDQTSASLGPLFHLMMMDLAVRWSGYFACSTMLALEEVAIFSTAQRTAMLISFVLIGVNLYVSPRFARAFACNDRERLDVLALQASHLMIAFSLPMLISVMFFPNYIMGMFGKEYEQGSVLLQIMAIGQFVNVLTGSVGYLLTMTGHEKDYRQAVFATAPIAMLTAPVLTHYFGAVGCAVATSISIASQNLFATWMVKKKLGFNNLNIFRRVRS